MGVSRRLLVYGLLVLGAGWWTGGCGDSADKAGHNSPTGTFFDDPDEGSGLPPGSYVALDEACERTDDPDYLRRFETPMFRSVATRDEVAWLVDGSLLWAVDLSDPAHPERRSLTRLDGHPLQVDVTAAGHLLVAAGEAGLHVVDIQDAAGPAVLQTVVLDDMALDVRVAGDLAWWRWGAQGCACSRWAPRARPQCWRWWTCQGTPWPWTWRGTAPTWPAATPCRCWI